jgi:hypothetical protein
MFWMKVVNINKIHTISYTIFTQHSPILKKITGTITITILIKCALLKVLSKLLNLHCDAYIYTVERWHAWTKHTLMQFPRTSFPSSWLMLLTIQIRNVTDNSVLFHQCHSLPNWFILFVLACVVSNEFIQWTGPVPEPTQLWTNHKLIYKGTVFNCRNSYLLTTDYNYIIPGNSYNVQFLRGCKLSNSNAFLHI